MGGAHPLICATAESSGQGDACLSSRSLNTSTGFDMVPKVLPNPFLLERFDRPAIGVAVLALELVKLDGFIASISKLNPAYSSPSTLQAPPDSGDAAKARSGSQFVHVLPWLGSRPRLTPVPLPVTMNEQVSPTWSKEDQVMRAHFLGKDPESHTGESPTLFATDRTDRVTYIAQGWKVTDPQALTDVGDVSDHETLIEIPEDVLKMYARRYLDEGGTL